MLRPYIHVTILVTCAALSSACIHRAASIDSLSPPIEAQAGARHVLAGEWEYIDSSGAAILLMLDEQGNGHYDWKNGRLETRTLIGHIWNGVWFQEENDREGGFTVWFSPDFSEGEGQWWYTRIGADHAPPRKGGTFQLKSSIGAG